MVADRVSKTLKEKSNLHRLELERLGQSAGTAPLSNNIVVIPQTRQIVGMNTILLNPETPREDFIHFFDRLASLLVE